MIRRRYVDAGRGQLHLRESGTAAGGIPLVCLHATAYSSRTFETLMQEIGEQRHVIAMDTPGYGGSDPLPGTPDIAAYADALAAALEPAFDILGYHTGVAIGIEMAIRHPDQVRSLVLIGVPYFQALDFAAWKTRLATPHRLEEGLGQFAERWDYLVAKRPARLPLDRGFANFIDELRAWPDGSAAHQALFSWDMSAQLTRVTVPVHILNFPGHLAEPSRAAARLMSRATLVELPGGGGAPLEFAAASIAAEVLRPSVA